MFPGKTRPVPSKGALRALYQLAYISSGTAVGIAALCAEEKRRRAQILQKVADNAKRIRGSSRYVGNVAYEKPKGARTEELPSRVEEGYEQLMEKDWKRRRRRRECSNYDGHGPSEKEQTLDGDSPTGGGTQASKNKRSRPSRQRFRTVEYELFQPVGRGASQLTPDSVSPDRVRKPIIPRPQVAAFLQSRQIEHMSEDMFLQGHRTIEDDIYELSTLPPESMLSSDKAELVNQLFAVATEKGMFSYVQNTYDWKNNNNEFTEHDLTLLVESLPLLKRHVNHLELIQFFTHVLSSRSFQCFSPQVRLSFGMSVTVDAVDWDLEAAFHSVRRLMGATLQQIVPSEVQKAFEQCCDQLITLGKCDRARFLIVVGRMFPRSLKKPDPLLDRVFWSALATGDLQCCCNILKSRLRDYEDGRRSLQQKDGIVPFLEALTTACREQRHYRVLSSIVDYDYRAVKHQAGKMAVLRVFAPDLSTPAKSALAIATTHLHTFHAEYFDELYQHIPIEARPPIDEARVVTRITETWSATLNFDRVSVEHQSCVDFAIGVGNDEARLECDLAMVKVCNQANRPDRALEILSQIAKGVSSSGKSSSHIAAVLARHAKNNAWAELDKFLEVVDSAKIKLMTDRSSALNINATIHFYSLKHNASETWEFVSSLADRFDFRPNRATNLIMLKVFVSYGELDLLSRWLHETRMDGNLFDLDAETAASLLTTYYRKLRPPHSLMMQYSRKLLPAFNFESEALVAVVREAVGYDLRHSVVRLKARQNLSKLNAMRGINIPRPVQWKKLHQADNLQIAGVDSTSSAASFSDLHASPASGSSLHGEESCSSNMQAADLSGETSDTYQPFGYEMTASNVDADAAVQSNDQSTGPPKHDSRNRDPVKPAESELPSESVSAHTGDHDDHQDLSSPAAANEPRETNLCANVPCSDDGTASDAEALEIHAQRTRQNLERPGAGQQTSEAAPIDSSQTQANQSELIRTMDSLYGDGHDVSEPAPLTDTDSADAWYHRDSENDRTESIPDEGVDDGRETHSPDLPATYLEKQRLLREVTTRFSLRQYQEVLSLYHENLSPSGLPVSSRVLEVAVEASLRLHGNDSTDAEQILNRAREAGMNVDAAMKHVKIHDIWRLDPAERRNANTLRLKVIDFYRFHAENKLPVSHYVAITAADVLIRHDRAAHGVNLLAAIYRSEWTTQDKLDIVAMTVWVKGYHGLKSEFRNGVEGLVWILNTVFKDNIRINRDFVITVKAAFRDFGMPDWSNTAQRRRLLASASVSGVPRMLLMLYRRCIVQWNRQQDEAFQQGWKLVQIIRDYVLQEKGSVNPRLAISSTQQVREEELAVDANSISSTDGSGLAELISSSRAQDLSRAEVQEQNLKDIDQDLPDEVKAVVEAPGLETGRKRTRPRIRVSTLAEHEARQLRRDVYSRPVRPRRVRSSKGGRA